MITDREIIMAIVDNDCLTKSDAAVLLEGDGFFRFQKAVELYKQGTVSKIIFSGNIIDKDYGSFPFEEVKPYIINGGVPEEDLIHEDKSQHTRQQAIEVVKMAKEYGWKKLALVASHEHQYRAYLTFLREVLDTNSGIILYNAPVRNLNWFIDSGWGQRFDRLSAEIERIEKYSAMGHLANAQEVIEYQKWKESLLNG
ncbi:MAG: YdcF family protein [Eubacteriales bacterium]|nr:YdcF family protein [Eubacteriales bacterium]